MGPSQVFAWLGNEKNRARLQRRFFRFFLPSYRVLALGLGILCLVNLGTHWEREEQGKDERGSDFAHDVGRQIAEGEKGGWSFHSHRRLTSSVLGSEPLTGKSMAASLSIFPRTLPPKPTQNLRPLTQVRTLRFQTCNGFANQRLSLAYGVILAKLTNRVPVLPDFLLNGLQRSDKWVTDAGSNGSLPMPDVYDVQAFREGLSRVGMEILTPEEAPPISVYLELTLENVTDAVSHIERKHDLHVQIDCPFLRLPKEVVKANEDVFWAVLESLEPTKKYVSIVDEAVRRLTELGLQSAEKAPATLQEAERRIQSESYRS